MLDGAGSIAGGEEKPRGGGREEYIVKEGDVILVGIAGADSFSSSFSLKFSRHEGSKIGNSPARKTLGRGKGARPVDAFGTGNNATASEGGRYKG